MSHLFRAWPPVVANWWRFGTTGARVPCSGPYTEPQEVTTGSGYIIYEWGLQMIRSFPRTSRRRRAGVD